MHNATAPDSRINKLHPDERHFQKGILAVLCCPFFLAPFFENPGLALRLYYALLATFYSAD
jgi:hypothetical protein